MEFGPRTLGARSILASPTDELMRDNLNIFIKHREEYRPFSAAVPEERAEEFFEPSELTDFLQGVSHIREGKEQLIPAAVFGKGLVRVQSVSRKTNPAFWKLLVKFEEATGCPCFSTLHSIFSASRWFRLRAKLCAVSTAQELIVLR